MERDIMLWKTEIERQKEAQAPQYRDGDMLFSDMPPQPHCNETCRFKKSLVGTNPHLYLCQKHFRFHECGEACCAKVQSRENWTCPWTKNVLNISLIAEEKTSAANCGRHQSGETYSKRGFGDEASDKNEKRMKRVSDAMHEASGVCLDALDAEGVDRSEYSKLLNDYFSTIAYHTDMFGESRVLTKKAVVQFGLACSYMLRNGFSISDPRKSGCTIHFFEKSTAFEAKLPKTHALIQLGYKVRAVTRTQDLLKRYLSEALVKAPDLDLAFVLPPKSGSVPRRS